MFIVMVALLSCKTISLCVYVWFRLQRLPHFLASSLYIRVYQS